MSSPLRCKWHLITIVGVVMPSVFGYTVTPPTTAPSDTITDCTNWAVASSSDTCDTLAADGSLTLDQLYDYNPSLADGCNIIVGDSYCIEENFGIPPATTSSTSTSPTTTGDGVSTPTPIQTGMATNCDMFYLVQKGDGCSAIAASYGISLTDFYAWNPAVGTSCTDLDYADYVCVGIIGQTAVPTTTTTTTPTNGITTPQPIQTGMVSDCDDFYLVQAGDSCQAVATTYGISLATFYAWNPAVGTSCTNLDYGDYVCVGTLDQTTTLRTTTTTTSTPTNGISTPTPTQTGMVSNCDDFYLVVSGDTCFDIATGNGITLDEFYAWNPAVGTSCSGLDFGYYVCVGIIGGSSTTTTTTPPSTSTTSGNGVTTPTPIEPGMVTNCDAFHYVISGDTCPTIATSAGITLDEFYSWNTMVGSSCGDLWLDSYVCVGVL